MQRDACLALLLEALALTETIVIRVSVSQLEGHNKMLKTEDNKI